MGLLSKVPDLRLIAKRELDIMDIQKENPDLSLTSKLETRQERERELPKRRSDQISPRKAPRSGKEGSSPGKAGLPSASSVVR